MMKRVLVLGANGQIARLARAELLEQEVEQVLFLRKASRVHVQNTDKEIVFEGDASKVSDLEKAMDSVDIVYANLAGSNIVAQAKAVVTAMNNKGINRLIWISTLGIYDEVPGKYGQWNHQMLDGGYLETYSEAAKVIEQSNLAYTIIRPAWLSNKDEVDYELTKKGEDFKGTEVSRKSIGYLVATLVAKPDQYIRESLGVNKPNTDGDKPAWY